MLAGWLVFSLSVSSVAQETGDAVEPLPEGIAADFDRALAEIKDQREDVATLEQRAARRDGEMAELLTVRRDRIWADTAQRTVDLVRQVVSQRDNGRDVSAYWQQVTEELQDLAIEARGAIERVRERTIFPDPDLETREFVIADQNFFKGIEQQNRLFKALMDYIEFADHFGLDASADREYLVSMISDHTANVSVFLLMAQNDVDILQSAVVTLPNDTELADWLSTANTRITLTAAALQEAADVMRRLGLETRIYRQQLLTATGEITADVLDVGLVRGLLIEWSEAGADLARKRGIELLFRGLFIALILFVFWQLGKIVQRLLDRAFSSSRVRMSHLLKKMIVSMCRNAIFFIGLLLAITQMGISLGPLLAGLGIAGFIIGFALQDTLSNFASGVMILIYRPFDVGDVVEAGGVQGKVSHMSLVNTTFMTLDNQRLVVPNNLIWQTVITNKTAQRVRRVDLTFGVSYGDDLDKVEKLLLEVVESHEAVLESPEPMIKLHELGESSVNFIVRPWVKTDDYWDTYWDLTKAVKQRFDKEGISIPFPQRDVHVIEKL